MEGPQYSIKQKYKERLSSTPGPGSYESKIARKQGYTMGKKFEKKGPEDAPGPGNYEQKSTINNGPSYSMTSK